MNTDDSRREPIENWDGDFEEDHSLPAMGTRPPSSAYTVSSQTLLRPHTQASPPVHRARERRRLRKKSRPPGSNVFELMDVGPTRLDRNMHGPVHSDDVYQDATAQAAPPTTSTGPTLLSRIGIVNKWGVRRKKGSSAPTASTPDDSGEPRVCVDVRELTRVFGTQGIRPRDAASRPTNCVKVNIDSASVASVLKSGSTISGS